MSDMIETSRLDYFQHVLEYIGFAPSRYYLRESCKALYKAVPARVYVSMREFSSALHLRFVNPRNLFIAPAAEKDGETIGRVLFEIGSLEIWPIQKMLLERTLMDWESGTVAESDPYYLDMIKWKSWCIGSNEIFAKASECRRFAIGDDRFTQKLFTEPENLMKGVDVTKLEFWKRFLIDWGRPSDDDEWEELIRFLVQSDADQEAIDYLAGEADMDWMLCYDIMQRIGRSSNLERMKSFLSCMSEELDRMVYAIQDSLETAVSRHNDAMVRFLVDMFGIHRHDICLDLFKYDDHDPPDIGLIDFLISRGADINSRSSENHESCLDLALIRGYWGVADALVSRGAKVGSLSSVLKDSAVGKNVDLFRTYLRGNESLLGMDRRSLLSLALDCSCAAEVVEEVFNVSLRGDLTFVRYAFIETLSAKRKTAELPEFVLFLQKLVGMDPSVVNARLRDSILPLRALELYEPSRRVRWSGKLGILYLDPNLCEDWFETYPDPEQMKVIAALKNTLIEYRAEPDPVHNSGPADDDLFISYLSLDG